MATPPCLSPFELESARYFVDEDGGGGDDFSSGYLEDALLEFGDRSKRRRLSFSSSDRAFLLGYVNSGTQCNLPSQDYRQLSSTEISRTTEVTDDLGGISVLFGEEETMNAASETQASSEDATSFSSLDSSTCYPISHARRIPNATPSGIAGCLLETEKRENPGVIKGVAYPFALVKPGGSEDDVTLEDINARILMTPSRPVRHPVGDFAGRPYGGGPGLSGKAVVGLTRVNTQGGRGSITIIRTKG
ncbi:hypothetical protein MLD38_003833 [Melastoma candidum]|uniref:Uncharacterized protein n=1 Tax=Melastoma candidum TaxID=119954 RepID=A0ACB9S3I0_9MYRT|nr:hypothetical protein MLD38_003833 [Melastoma candidum]